MLIIMNVFSVSPMANYDRNFPVSLMAHNYEIFSVSIIDANDQFSWWYFSSLTPSDWSEDVVSSNHGTTLDRISKSFQREFR